jgi:metal-responsive CopG/Arc/MetJ family transcriptional regulator
LTKFSLPKASDKGTRSSIRIPRPMLEKIDRAMAGSGYNKKQRSRWIEDITHHFLQRSDAANLVAEEFIVPGSTEAIPVTLTAELDEKINLVLEQVIQEEGIRKDRSSLLRTAITQHLLAMAGMQLSPRETRSQWLQQADDENAPEERGREEHP